MKSNVKDLLRYYGAVLDAWNQENELSSTAITGGLSDSPLKNVKELLSPHIALARRARSNTKFKQLEDDVVFLSSEIATLKLSLKPSPAEATSPKPSTPEATAARTTCAKCQRAFKSRNKMMKHVVANVCGGESVGKEANGGKI